MALFLVTFVRKDPVRILWFKVKTESISLSSLSPDPAVVVLPVLLSLPNHAAAHSGEGQSKQAAEAD